MREFMKFSFVLFTLFSVQLQAQSPLNFNLDAEHVPYQLIIKYRDNIPQGWDSFVKRTLPQLNRFGAEKSPSNIAVLDFSSIHPDKSDLKKLASILSEIPNIESVESNAIYHLDETIPDDPDFDLIYSLKNSDDPTKDTDATLAWDISVGSREVVVGVIDTGIDYTHPDIIDNYWSNPGEIGTDSQGRDKSSNGIDDDGNGYIDDYRGWDFINGDNDPMDDHSHGTHCAGTIGATGNNGQGIVGINWQVSLVALKVFSGSGSTTVEALTEAINYATSIGVDLTSNSWGGGSLSEALQSAIGAADAAGILFVAAAGNSSRNNDISPHYPSSYGFDNIVAVASTDRYDELSYFSSYGAESVDVAAAGSSVYSTTPGGNYGYKSGTSMATPLVAGLLALAKSVYPDLDAYELKEKVLGTAEPLPSLEGKVAYGRINALNALELDSIPPDAPDIRIEDEFLNSIKISVSPTGDDGMEGQASYYLVLKSDDSTPPSDWTQGKKVFPNGSTDDEGRLLVTIEDLPFGATGYITIKAVDNVGNTSEYSNTASFALKEPIILSENDGDLSTFSSIDEPWGVELMDGNSFISDSPSGNYVNYLDASIVTESYDVQPGLLLVMQTKYEIETNYDYGYVEVSVDEGDWTTLSSLTGYKDWHEMTINLDTALEGATSFQIRFRLASDFIIVADGWLIDSYKIVGPAL